MNSSEDYFQEIEETLSFIAHNMVQQEDELVSKLLHSNEGEWLDLLKLSEGTERIQQPLLDLWSTEFSSEEYVGVTWLNYPFSVYGEGCCLIIFFCDALFWYQIAIYNRERLLAKKGGNQRK